MITGYTSGIGGASWTYYPPPSDDGIAIMPTLTSDGTRTLYIVQEKLSQWGQPLPAQPVGQYQWRMVAPVGTDIEAGGIVVSGSYAFAVGTLDTYQGFPTAICTVTTAPSTASTGGGYRSPLWLLGVSA